MPKSNHSDGVPDRGRGHGPLPEGRIDDRDVVDSEGLLLGRVRPRFCTRVALLVRRDNVVALPRDRHARRVDYTSFFRALSASLLGDAARARSLFDEPAALDAWSERWRARLPSRAADLAATAAAMDRVNPLYVPRNQQVEEALAAATDGDLGPFRRLHEVLAQPFVERPGLEQYAAPAPPSFGAYRTPGELASSCRASSPQSRETIEHSRSTWRPFPPSERGRGGLSCPQPPAWQ